MNMDPVTDGEDPQSPISPSWSQSNKQKHCAPPLLESRGDLELGSVHAHLWACTQHSGESLEFGDMTNIWMPRADVTT